MYVASIVRWFINDLELIREKRKIRIILSIFDDFVIRRGGSVEVDEVGETGFAWEWLKKTSGRLIVVDRSDLELGKSITFEKQ